jgi:hypothetical protein
LFNGAVSAKSDRNISESFIAWEVSRPKDDEVTLYATSTLYSDNTSDPTIQYVCFSLLEASSAPHFLKENFQELNEAMLAYHLPAFY